MSGTWVWKLNCRIVKLVSFTGIFCFTSKETEGLGDVATHGWTITEASLKCSCYHHPMCPCYLVAQI